MGKSNMQHQLKYRTNFSQPFLIILTSTYNTIHINYQMTFNHLLPQLQPYKDKIPQFIMKLYHILQKKQHEEFLTWNGNDQIVIKQPKRFQEKVLPKYFRHKHLSSFIRQLNMYKFSKVSKLIKQKNHMYFKNQYFHRGEIQLLLNLKRNTKKNRGTEETMAVTLQKIEEMHEKQNSESVSLNEIMHENEKSQQVNEKLQAYKQHIRNSALKIIEIVSRVTENRKQLQGELKTVIELCQQLIGVKKEEEQIKQKGANGLREADDQMSFLNVSLIGLSRIQPALGYPSISSLYNFNSINRF